jgi:two-component system phosphate regulon sensor histidine kinase PhoR
MRLGWASKVALLSTLPILLGLGALVLIELRDVRETTSLQLEKEMKGQVQILARLWAHPDGSIQPREARIRALAEVLGDRLTVIDGDGVVLADSEVGDVAHMENHSSRKEVLAARADGVSVVRRWSRTVKRELVYAAARVPNSDAVVRIARDLSGFEAEIDRPTSTFYRTSAIILVLGATIAFVLARGLIRPVRELTVAAEAVSRGDLARVVRPTGTDEVAHLGEAFNRMTGRLRETISRAEEEAAWLATILEGMNEGVVAIDDQERISFLNGAAREILAVPVEEKVEGRRLYELVRDPRLLGTVQAVRGGGRPIDGEFTQEGPPQRMIQMHAARIGDGRTNTILVLRDMSRLRRLERMRSDFVSNVSHELRTPLASIAAAVETLEDAVSRRDEDTGPRFVAMIRRNVARLEALLDDILALSRFESRPETVKKGTIDLITVVRTAADDFQERARAAKLELRTDIGERVPVLGDRLALRRIVDNLILNAITYTPAGGHVWVTAKEEEGRAELRVRDDGIGIPSGDIDRIFERFYRVDKARSRSAGGTGLGLAIVKHAVGLHGGTIEVRSEPGRGSEFIVRIPRLESEAPPDQDPAGVSGRAGHDETLPS